jgi:hypothetical protein
LKKQARNLPIRSEAATMSAGWNKADGSLSPFLATATSGWPVCDIVPIAMSTKELVAELAKLDQAGLAQFISELERNSDLAEDIYDLLAFKMRAAEPSRPFEEFVRDLDPP